MRLCWARWFIVLSLMLCAPLSASAQVVLYAGHSGNGDSESAPGSFSSVDPATGQVTIIGKANVSNGGVAGLATDGREIFAALVIQGSATLVTIRPATGTVDRTIGPVILSGGGACTIGDLAMGADGVLYGITANGQGHVCDGKNAGTLLKINTTTAVATAIGRPIEAAYPQANNTNGGLAVDGAGRLWLSPGWNHPDPGKFFVVDPSTGLIIDTLVLTGDSPNQDGANGLAWNPSDGRLYASYEQYSSGPAGRRGLWVVNTSTGASEYIADTGYHLHDLLFVASASRAPALGAGASVLLFALMLAFGIGVVRRRASA